METMTELLGSHPFFAGLSPGAVELIAGCASSVHAEGDRIFDEGEPASLFYAIRHGGVALELHSSAKGPVVIDTMNEGEVLGWSWLVPPYRYFAYATGDAGQRDRAGRRLPARQVRGRRGAGLSAAEAGHDSDVPPHAGRAPPAARPVRVRIRAKKCEDPAGLFGGTPPGFQSSGVPVVHDLLCGRLVCRLAPRLAAEWCGHVDAAAALAGCSRAHGEDGAFVVW